MSLIREGRAFVAAVFREWVAFVTGAGSILLGWGLRLARVSHLQVDVAFVVGVFFLLVACFLAWRREYRKYTPGLTLKIENVATARYRGRERDTSFQLVVSASNIGSPSIIDDYQLSVRSLGAGAQVRATLIVRDSSEPIVMAPTDSAPIEYSPRDWLYDKTIQPLPTGAKVAGFLEFAVLGMTQATASQLGTTLELSAKDVTGAALRASFEMGSETTAPPWRPGLVVPRSSSD